MRLSETIQDVQIVDVVDLILPYLNSYSLLKRQDENHPIAFFARMCVFVNRFDYLFNQLIRSCDFNLFLEMKRV